MKGKILFFLILLSCSISQLKAPSGYSIFREPISSRPRSESFNGSRESDVVGSELFSRGKKKTVDPHIAEKASLGGQKSSEGLIEDQSKIQSEEFLSEGLQKKSNFLGIDFAGLFSRENRSVAEKSMLDKKLDSFENKILDEYRDKNKFSADPATQAQADVYIKRSFQDVYKGCKDLIDGDFSSQTLTPFAKFVKIFNRSVSITTKLCALKSQRFIGKSVDGMKSVAERFNLLSKEDQQAVYNDMVLKNQGQVDLISGLEKQLSLKEKEFNQLQQRLDQVQRQRDLDYQRNYSEGIYLADTAKAMQRSLQDQIDYLMFENKQIIKELLPQDSHLPVKPEQFFVVPSEQKLSDILQEEKGSEKLEKTDVSQVQLQKELQALKAQNALLLQQLEHTRQLGATEFYGEVKESLSDKVAMKVENGIATQEIKNEAGQIVSKKLFIINEDTQELIPFQEIVLQSSSLQSDGLMKVVTDVYALDDLGNRLNDGRFKEVKILVPDKQGSKIVKSKQTEDFSGNVLERTEYIPDENFDLGKLYDVSLIGLKRDGQFSIISYEKTLKNRLETVLVRAGIKGSLFEIKAVQSEKTANGIVSIINRIEIQPLDANGKVHGSPQVITETKKLDKNKNVMSKMVQVAGKTQAVEYVYDRSHDNSGDNSSRVNSEVVYEVKGSKFTEISRVSKEYVQDRDGSEIIIDKDKNGVITKVTKNGQEVAGLQGIFFDAIFDEAQFVNQLNRDVSGKLSQFQVRPKVEEVVANYKKEIRDNIARELDLSIDSVKQSAPTFDDVRAQKHIDDVLDKVYKSYEKQIDLFITPIKDNFITNLKVSEPEVLESNLSRAKPLAKINSSEKNANEKAIKFAQQNMENQIRQQKMIEMAREVESYTPEQKEDLLFSYLAERGVVSSQGLSSQVKSEYLKIAQNEKITKLVNEAMQSSEVKKLIKDAGNQATVQSTASLPPKDLSSLQEDSSSDRSLSSQSAPSFLDAIKKAKEQSVLKSVEGGSHADGPPQKLGMIAELQARLKSRGGLQGGPVVGS